MRQTRQRMLLAAGASLAIGSLAAGALVAAAPQAPNTSLGTIDILEVGTDPAFPPTYNQTLTLRVRLANKGTQAAKGAWVEARVGLQAIGKADLNGIGGGEIRTLSLQTRFRPGVGESCVQVVPGTASDSPVKPGATRQVCLTPGCYSLSDRPGPPMP